MWEIRDTIKLLFEFLQADLSGKLIYIGILALIYLLAFRFVRYLNKDKSGDI